MATTIKDELLEPACLVGVWNEWAMLRWMARMPKTFGRAFMQLKGFCPSESALSHLGHMSSLSSGADVVQDAVGMSRAHHYDQALGSELLTSESISSSSRVGYGVTVLGRHKP